VRPFGISRDSPWSHEAWAATLGIGIPLLSDWTGKATRAFGVGVERFGMRVSARTAFLADAETVRAVWKLGSELPDVDAILAAACALRPAG
jgi:peroxiredoxin